MAQEAAEAPSTFKPYVPDSSSLAEFTPRALILGMLFGIVFGAVTVYVGLRAGLTVSASIPIAVLSISLLRALGKSTILENNIVQTTGSAGESVAAGVIFTLPALVFLGFPLEYSRIFLLAMIGGALGVLFMIPLRRQLIVKEHGNLLYPEGAACADVLVAGEKGGSFASRVFIGLGLGGVYTLLQNGNAIAAIKETPTYNPAWLPGSSMRAAITSEYLGVGYIIGPRVAGTIFAGGVFSWLVLMPAIKFFGSLVPTPIYPSPIPIAQMTSDNLWNYYIRYIGAGAVAAAGLITLVKTLPTIVSALRAGAAEMSKRGEAAARVASRTAHDIPLTIVLAGSAAVVLALWSLLTLYPVPGAQLGVFKNAIAGILVVIFGFLFVTVSSRICGLIGTSANPISGMTIATLMATCALFLAAGWTAPAYEALALVVGGTVCIAAANAGATSQDLKTGYIVGATPYHQQLGLFAGVFASSFVIGLTLIGMNKGLETFEPVKLELNVSALPEGVVVEGQMEHEGRTFTLLNSIGSRTIPEGKFLADPATGQVELQWTQGIGSQDAPAPQARLMSVVIKGILTQKLPWGLVLLGVFLVVAVELLGIRSLSFAVGSYLSIGTTAAIFCGGLVKSLAERGQKQTEEGEASPGALFASGLIAAGGIVGLFAIGIKLLETQGVLPKEAIKFGPMLGLAGSDLVGILAFAALGYSLYYYSRKPLVGPKA
jgi:putative OPT family oligopeptide transporter